MADRGSQDRPASARRRGRSERSKPSIFWVMALIVIPLMGLMVRYRFVDAHKVPRNGPCIIAPNHYSEIDPVVVGAAMWKLGRLPRFLAKASLFRVPVLGWFLRASGQIPVERGGSKRGTPLVGARALVENGSSVIVYPEGSLTRDPDMWPMRGKSGAARLALAHGIPVIPVAHWGTQELMGRYSKKISVFPRKTITFKFGDPVDLSAYTSKPLDSSTLAGATDEIMRSITDLLGDLRGLTPPAERWDPNKHDQEETGRFES